MSQFVEDCPRCDTKRITFELLASVQTGLNYGWQKEYEVFGVCGHCNTSTVFVIGLRAMDTERILSNVGGLIGFKGSINGFVTCSGYISAKDEAAIAPPQFLPDNILAAFTEGSRCLAIDCFNAAGTMFRLCVDMTTKDKMPEGEALGLNYKTRRDLGLRLPWLFDNRYLPEDLRDLSHCIKEDGNDGAHQGTLSEADALDLLDFTTELLERVYTQPEKVRLADERRAQRRGG